MEKILKAIWRFYAVVGAIWLTFTLISMFYFPRPTIHNIDGIVKEVVAAEWDGYHDDIAIIQTDDSKGNVLARDYRGRMDVGDRVSLKISTGGITEFDIYTTMGNAPRRKDE